LKLKNDQHVETINNLKLKIEEFQQSHSSNLNSSKENLSLISKLKSEATNLNNQIQSLSQQLSESESQLSNLKQKIYLLSQEKVKLDVEVEQLRNSNIEQVQSIKQMEDKIGELENNQDQLQMSSMMNYDLENQKQKSKDNEEQYEK